MLNSKKLFSILFFGFLMIMFAGNLFAQQLTPEQLKAHNDQGMLLQKTHSKLLVEAAKLNQSGDKLGTCNKFKEARNMLLKMIDHERSLLRYDIPTELRDSKTELIGAANNQVKAIDQYLIKHNCPN